MDERSRDAILGWAKFLNPEFLKGNLIAASLFLAGFETLRAVVIGRIRDFYTDGFDEHGFTVSDEYRRTVLSRDKGILTASLLWLRDYSIVDDADIDLVRHIREHRNEIAHELPRFLSTVDAEISVELLGGILRLVSKIDRWWIREVEIPLNPDLCDKEVDYDAIESGSMLFLRLMIEIASAKEPDSAAIYQEFLKHAEQLQRSAGWQPASPAPETG